MRHAPSKIRSWERTAANERLARSEAEELVRLATGAEAVYAFDHTWRSSKRSNFDSSLGPGGLEANVSSAVARAHTDTTPSSAGLKVAELVDRGILPRAVQAPTHRRMIVNVWRAYGTGEAVRSFPLGCIKHGTVLPEERFAYTLAHEGVCGVNGSVCYGPLHEWHYYDAMTPEEVLLLVNHEEPRAGGGEARAVYHAALELLGQDPAAERVSIEVRVLALLPQ